MSYMSELEDAKMNMGDRVLLMEKIHGQNTKNSAGLTDNRLFSGENKLHAIMDMQTTLWHFKQDSGGLPGALKQRFTSFKAIYTYAETYFAKRGIKITGYMNAKTSD